MKVKSSSINFGHGFPQTGNLPTQSFYKSVISNALIAMIQMRCRSSHSNLSGVLKPESSSSYACAATHSSSPTSFSQHASMF